MNIENLIPDGVGKQGRKGSHSLLLVVAYFTHPGRKEDFLLAWQQLSQ